MRPYLLNFYNTNGPDLAIPRATRQSFVIGLESLTSLGNTMTEIVLIWLTGLRGSGIRGLVFSPLLYFSSHEYVFKGASFSV